STVDAMPGSQCAALGSVLLPGRGGPEPGEPAAIERPATIAATGRDLPAAGLATMAGLSSEQRAVALLRPVSQQQPNAVLRSAVHLGAQPVSGAGASASLHRAAAESRHADLRGASCSGERRDSG